MAAEHGPKTRTERVIEAWHSLDVRLPEEYLLRFHQGWVSVLPSSCQVAEHRKARRRGTIIQNIMSRVLLGQPPENYIKESRYAGIGTLPHDEMYLEALRGRRPDLTAMPPRMLISDHRYMPQNPVDGRTTVIRNTVATYTVAAFVDAGKTIHHPRLSFRFLEMQDQAGSGPLMRVDTESIQTADDLRCISLFMAPHGFTRFPSASDVSGMLALFNTCIAEAEWA